MLARTISIGLLPLNPSIPFDLMATFGEAKDRAQSYKTSNTAPKGAFNITMSPDDIPDQQDNVSYAYEWLTGSGIEDYTGGRMKRMSPAGASGMLGNWMTETGDSNLQDLDIIEAKARKGRGISQYTGARRTPYDSWRQGVLSEGGDPNSMQNQLEYFADEYLGKYDPNGNSLVGYTKALDELGGMNATQAATHLQRDFFRPSEPHLDRRIKNANNVFNRFN